MDEPGEEEEYREESVSEEQEDSSSDTEQTSEHERGSDRPYRGDARLARLSRPSTPPVEIPRPDGTERGQFLHDLYSFMQRIGQPITKVPHLGYQVLDLYKLYQIVVARGGMDEVTRRQEWKSVYTELGIPTMSTSASYNTRTNYKKHLYLYELEHGDFNDRRPLGKEPLFKAGEHVRIVSSNYAGQVFYAKVVKIRWRNMKNMYYVHYNGWSTSHDEWMPEAVLSPLLKGEQQDPESLVNPHPNRSSKSNHIIGELPPEHKPKAHRAKSGAKHEGTESDRDEDAVPYRPSPRKETPTQGRERKMRGRPRAEVASGGGGGGVVSTGPSIDRVRAEMDKLAAESILDYVPPKDVRFIQAENLHRYSVPRTVPGFRKELLEGVDLRVPNLEDVVGRPPVSSPPPKRTAKAGEWKDRSEAISALKRELQEIKKEYNVKRRLMKIYYGSSSEDGSGTASSSPSRTSGTASPSGIPRRTRRGRAG